MARLCQARQCAALVGKKEDVGLPMHQVQVDIIDPKPLQRHIQVFSDTSVIGAPSLK